MKKITVEKFGSPAWPRYVLHDDQGRWWTGDGWSGDRRSALLYADWNDVSHEYRRLEAAQWSSLPLRNFEATISVQVRSGQDFTIEQLQDYLYRAITIMLNHEGHGSGPVPDSMARIDIDWAKLNEAEPKEQP